MPEQFDTVDAKRTEINPPSTISVLNSKGIGMNKAEVLILKYYQMNKEIKRLTKEISIVLDSVRDNENLRVNDEHWVGGSHLDQYFDSALRYKISFEDYCLEELDMDEPCPACMEIIELIRERRSLHKPFGIVKREIMALGKKIKDKQCVK